MFPEENAPKRVRTPCLGEAPESDVFGVSSRRRLLGREEEVITEEEKTGGTVKGDGN
jgi:hypothetical protein